MLLSLFRVQKPSHVTSHLELARNIRSIALVGNGPVDDTGAKMIDHHDWVVRFNLAPHCGVAGRRTDTMVMVNRGSPARTFRRHPDRISSIAIRGAREFLFACDPNDLPPPYSTGYSDGHGDATTALVRKIVGDRPYMYVPTGMHLELVDELIARGAKPDVLPSTGALAIKFFRTLHPDAELYLFGFSHSGWSGHSWDAERRWVDSLPNVIRL